MMARKLDAGMDRISAASAAYASTAFPMLTGTLVTVAGFLPVGLARSSAGEYTLSIFQVVAIAVLLSWIGAVLFTPFLGFRLLKAHGAPHESYATPFYSRLRRAVDWSVERRVLVIAATVLLFIAGGLAFTKVPKQFFPQSNRLAVGPPFEYPLIVRVTGDDPARVRALADRVAEIVRANPKALDVNDDWHERIPAMTLALNQDKARALGVTSEGISQALQAHYRGLVVGQYREGTDLIDIVWRARRDLRAGLE